MYAYAGTTSVQALTEQADRGDQKVKEMLEAFCYQVAKEIAAMSCAAPGKIDRVILTGGIAYSEPITERLREQTEWIAPVTIYPGEDEMLSLAQGALRVLTGEEEAKEYRPQE